MPRLQVCTLSFSGAETAVIISTRSEFVDEGVAYLRDITLLLAL